MINLSTNTSITKPSTASYLDDLTPELKILIIEELCEDISSLRSLILTCRTFQALAEPVLYRRACIRQGDNCHNLLKSIESCRQRADFVHVLDARYRYGHRLHPASMSEVLRQSGNLRELVLESPYSHYRNWTSEMYWNVAKNVIFQPLLESVLGICDPISGLAPLRNLKQLTLYWRNGGDTRHWSIVGAGAAVFIHPSLVHLEISCANIDDDVLDGFLGQGSTPLKTLILAECNISPEGLHKILSKPRALSSLYIGENRDHQRGAWPGFNNLLVRDHMKFFAALNQQSHSLINLTYKSSQIILETPKLAEACEGFAHFPFLEEITFEAGCPLLLTSIATKFLSPPNLSRVYIIGFPQADVVDAESDIYLLGDTDAAHALTQADQQYKSLAQLQSLEQVCFLIMNRTNLQTTIRQEVVEAKSKIFTSAGKRFMVVNRCQNGDKFPPYVCFEQKVISRTLFDSGTGGWEPFMKRWQPCNPSVGLLALIPG